MIYGLVYFLATPSSSMLLILYVIGNMDSTSWGTREVDLQSTKGGKTNRINSGSLGYQNDEETSCSIGTVCK